MGELVVAQPRGAGEIGPGICRKIELIDNIPAEGEPGETRYGRGSDHLIADKQSPSRFRRKSASKPLRTSLLGFDE